MNQEYPVRIIKWGLIFLGDKGTASFNNGGVTIKKSDGSVAFQFGKDDVRKGAVNDMNGMWTIKLNDKRILNIAGIGPSKSDFSNKLEEIMSAVGQ